MPIWKLTPINTDARDWEGSTHKGNVIVRAATDNAARVLATREFGIAVVSTGNSHETPWGSGDLSTCEPTDDPRFDDDGPEVVLEPQDQD